MLPLSSQKNLELRGGERYVPARGKRCPIGAAAGRVARKSVKSGGKPRSCGRCENIQQPACFSKPACVLSSRVVHTCGLQRTCGRTLLSVVIVSCKLARIVPERAVGRSVQELGVARAQGHAERHRPKEESPQAAAQSGCAAKVRSP